MRLPGRLLLGAAQLLSVAALLLCFRYVKSPALFGGRHLIETWMPFLVWLAPFALYAAVILNRRALPPRRRGWLVAGALAGNILLLVGYAEALAALDRRQRAEFMAFAERCMREHLADACPAGYPIFDPPPPPLHWEWALIAYVLAAAGMYFLLYVREQRMVRPEVEEAAQLGRDAPGP